jgi:hypothetical protein
MPAPNDLVLVTITAATGNETVSFKPSAFLACTVAKSVMISEVVKYGIAIRMNGQTIEVPNPLVYGGTIGSAGTPIVTFGTGAYYPSLTLAEASAGVAAVYAAVNAYYTAINS